MVEKKENIESHSVVPKTIWTIPEVLDDLNSRLWEVYNPSLEWKDLGSVVQSDKELGNNFFTVPRNVYPPEKSKEVTIDKLLKFIHEL